jgi:hypothetical protein
MSASGQRQRRQGQQDRPITPIQAQQRRQQDWQQQEQRQQGQRIGQHRPRQDRQLAQIQQPQPRQQRSVELRAWWKSYLLRLLLEISPDVIGPTGISEILISTMIAFTRDLGQAQIRTDLRQRLSSMTNHHDNLLSLTPQQREMAAARSPLIEETIGRPQPLSGFIEQYGVNFIGWLISEMHAPLTDDNVRVFLMYDHVINEWAQAQGLIRIPTELQIRYGWIDYLSDQTYASLELNRHRYGGILNDQNFPDLLVDTMIELTRTLATANTEAELNQLAASLGARPSREAPVRAAIDGLIELTVGHAHPLTEQIIVKLEQILTRIEHVAETRPGRERRDLYSHYDIVYGIMHSNLYQWALTRPEIASQLVEAQQRQAQPRQQRPQNDQNDQNDWGRAEPVPAAPDFSAFRRRRRLLHDSDRRQAAQSADTWQDRIACKPTELRELERTLQRQLDRPELRGPLEQARRATQVLDQLRSELNYVFATEPDGQYKLAPYSAWQTRLDKAISQVRAVLPPAVATVILAARSLNTLKIIEKTLQYSSDRVEVDYLTAMVPKFKTGFKQIWRQAGPLAWVERQHDQIDQYYANNPWRALDEVIRATKTCIPIYMDEVRNRQEDLAMPLSHELRVEHAALNAPLLTADDKALLTTYFRARFLTHSAWEVISDAVRAGQPIPDIPPATFRLYDNEIVFKLRQAYKDEPVPDEIAHSLSAWKQLLQQQQQGQQHGSSSQHARSAQDRQFQQSQADDIPYLPARRLQLLERRSTLDPRLIQLYTSKLQILLDVRFRESYTPQSDHIIRVRLSSPPTVAEVLDVLHQLQAFQDVVEEEETYPRFHVVGELGIDEGGVMRRVLHTLVEFIRPYLLTVSISPGDAASCRPMVFYTLALKAGEPDDPVLTQLRAKLINDGGLAALFKLVFASNTPIDLPLWIGTKLMCATSRKNLDREYPDFNSVHFNYAAYNMVDPNEASRLRNLLDEDSVEYLDSHPQSEQSPAIKSLAKPEHRLKWLNAVLRKRLYYPSGKIEDMQDQRQVIHDLCTMKIPGHTSRFLSWLARSLLYLCRLDLSSMKVIGDDPLAAYLKRYISKLLADQNETQLTKLSIYVHGIASNRPIKIVPTGGDANMLPVAHTCFGYLDVPMAYPNYEHFVERLEKAMELAGPGLDLA